LADIGRLFFVARECGWERWKRDLVLLGDFDESGIDVVNSFVIGDEALVAEPRFGGWDTVDEIGEKVEGPAAEAIGGDRPKGKL